MRGRAMCVAATVAAIACTTVAVGAIERTKLPKFPLTKPDGRVVTSDALVKAGRWLVVYVPPNCTPCEALLRLVVKAEHPQVPSRLAIIVGGITPDTLHTGAEQFPDLADASWFADPSGAAIDPLRLGTSPAIFGLNGDMIEWSVTGALSPTAELRSVLANWIEAEPRP